MISPRTKLTDRKGPAFEELFGVPGRAWLCLGYLVQGPVSTSPRESESAPRTISFGTP